MNYLKIARRNLLKNKVSSIINIVGLGAGMAVATLIGLWIYDEVTFNTSHENHASIGQLMTHNGDGTFSYLPYPLAREAKSLYPGDYAHVILASGPGDDILASGDKKFTQSGGWMQADAPDMLTLHMLSGTRAGLADPHSILLSSTAAQRLFGSGDPLGKIVNLDNTSLVKVTGVYADLPTNSDFHNLSFIAPWDLLVATNTFVKGDYGNWHDNSFQIYAQLSPHTTFETASAHLKNIERSHLEAPRLTNNPEIFIYPMARWHLHNAWENRKEVTSEAMKFVWFYASTGIFVLLLACINFMNLSTARSEKRGKEVGIRKTIGSGRGSLIRQFFTESLLTAAISFAVCIVLVQCLLPWFNQVAGKDILLPWNQPWFWAAGFTFTLVTGLLAGSYPALYLSAFRPVRVLKGPFKAGRAAGLPRKVLVVFQFTVSIALIIGTLVVYRQIQFAKDRPVGYTRQGMIQIAMTTPDFQGKYDVLTTELRATGVVTSMCESSLPVTATWSNTGGVSWKGMDPNIESDFAVVRVSPEYGKTAGVQLVDGRDFSRAYPTDSSGFLINEAAVRFMGLAHPVGEILHWKIPDDSVDRVFHIVGVIKDMVMNSPYEKVKQTLYWLGGDPSWISIRIRPEVSAGTALPKIEGVFKRIVPSAPFDYAFTDEAYEAKFQAEERVGSLAAFFAILAVIISCLGLFGLASFMAEQRTKEIGIRKVLGASVGDLWSLLSVDFMRLVLLSCVVAIPIAYYAMQAWLSKYEYRSPLSWWIMAGAGAGALVIALCTVSYQALRAARMNPVKSMKSE